MLLLPAGSAYAQRGSDSTFSLFFNSSLSFNHANDPHINRWLKEYGYPVEPHVPTSLSFEAAAMPANSEVPVRRQRASEGSASCNLSPTMFAIGTDMQR